MFIYSLLCRGGFHFLYRDLSRFYDSFIENDVPWPSISLLTLKTEVRGGWSYYFREQSRKYPTLRHGGTEDRNDQ